MAEAPTEQKSYTSARSLVKLLRKELLATDEGAFFSSAQDLINRFRISRSTLRQAVRVLEHEQLLIAKRGVSGGFFAARPKVDMVVAAAAAYLYARDVKLNEFVAVAKTLNVEMARLASTCTNTDLRNELEAILDANWRAPFSHPIDLLKDDMALEAHLSKMASSAVIELLLQLVYQVGMITLRTEAVLVTGDRMEPWRLQRLSLGEAILAQNVDLAIAFATRHYEIIEPWLLESE